LDASRKGFGDQLEGSEPHSCAGMAREARLCDCDFQGYQQVDSGTKMIQLGKDTSSACHRCLALRLVDDAFKVN